MLQVYDRVIPSKSIPTLIALSILAVLLYAFQGVFDTVRSRLLVRIAGVFDEVMSARVFRAVLQAPLQLGNGTDGMQVQRDFDQVKGFMTGSGRAPSLIFPGCRSTSQSASSSTRSSA